MTACADRRQRQSHDGGRLVELRGGFSAGEDSPSGLLRAFVPKSSSERTRLARQLRQAGIHRPAAMRDFFLMRSLLAILLPAALMTFYFVPVEQLQQIGLGDLRARLDQQRLIQGLVLLAVVGFYGPMLCQFSAGRAPRHLAARPMDVVASEC